MEELTKQNLTRTHVIHDKDTWIIEKVLESLIKQSKLWKDDDLLDAMIMSFMANNNYEFETLFKKVDQRQDKERYWILLAYLYERGLGIQSEKTKAFRWYHKAAKINDPIAMQKIGICYDESIGIKYDAIKARFWYKKAAEAGMLRSQFELAKHYIYRMNDSNKSHQIEGLYWLEKVANAGVACGMNLLANTYYIMKDYQKAFYWYKKSYYEHGSIREDLAICYRKGFGTLKDTHKAINCFLQPIPVNPQYLLDIFNNK
ncbi:4575_t:CDS:1 [Ambispora leptoticha]|uniref:4575_t:CDS:1 n=1 Tax=Ambispora leptoticha TaxID=144679 RepID=A0A9N9B247_9GLOM|nr:4575_t:CDS:1 [Ambispora leptoticha]